ncbi:uncharacterized protein LOC144578993 isoform X2 [Callithrix jacchus]
MKSLTILDHLAVRRPKAHEERKLPRCSGRTVAKQNSPGGQSLRQHFWLASSDSERRHYPRGTPGSDLMNHQAGVLILEATATGSMMEAETSSPPDTKPADPSALDFLPPEL